MQPEDMFKRLSENAAPSNEDSARLIEAQRRGLAFLSTTLLASKNLLNQWSQLNLDFAARAGGRMAAAQALPTLDEQTEKLGEVGMDNARDYFESIAKFSHQVMLTNQKLMQNTMMAANQEMSSANRNKDGGA